MVLLLRSRYHPFTSPYPTPYLYHSLLLYLALSRPLFVSSGPRPCLSVPVPLYPVRAPLPNPYPSAQSVPLYPVRAPLPSLFRSAQSVPLCPAHAPLPSPCPFVRASLPSPCPSTQCVTLSPVRAPLPSPCPSAQSVPLCPVHAPLPSPCPSAHARLPAYRGQRLVLYGELSKWVVMSPQRVTSIVLSSDDVLVRLAGSTARETVVFTFLLDSELHHVRCRTSGAGFVVVSVILHRCYNGNNLSQYYTEFGSRYINRL